MLRKPHQEAEDLIRGQIAKGEEIGRSFHERAAVSWDAENRTILERLFTGVEEVQYSNETWSDDPQEARILRIEWLESLRDRLRHYDLTLEARGVARAPIAGREAARSRTTKVFVIHGHDEAAKLDVARTLEHLELVPIVLHEQPDRGNSVLEKFEAHADVGYAVALLTPDDACGAGRRARQNVILELGYFLGALGRGNVRALYKPGVELPSDLHGWLYTEMDAAGAWKLLLARELRAAGFDVDLNRLA